jgi:hypothetical protein
MNPKSLIDAIEDFSEKLNQAGLRSSTLKRLCEAGFFLGKMNETYLAPDHQFDCYMTAYIMIARSVTWIMQSEFRHKDGFSEWFKAKQVSLQIEQLLKKFKKVRNAISKQRPLDLQIKCSMTCENFRDNNNTPMTQEEVVGYLNQLQGQKIALTLADQSNRNSGRLIAYVKDIEIEKIEHEAFSDILEECKVYFAFLAGITLESLTRFHDSFKKSKRIISIENRP